MQGASLVQIPLETAHPDGAAHLCQAVCYCAREVATGRAAGELMQIVSPVAERLETLSLIVMR